MAKYFINDPNIVGLLSGEEKATGGAAVQSYAWLNGLAATGNEVCVAKHEDQIGSVRPEFEHIALVTIYNRRKGLRWIRWIFYRFPNIYGALKKANPNYLYESIPSWESFFTGIICKLLGIKYIIRLSSDNLLDKRYLTRNSRFNQWLMRKGIGISDCVLCQNDYQLNLMKKMYPNTASIKIYNPIILQNQLLENTYSRSYIAWVANFRYLKNLKLLYEIALLLEDERFEIAGVYINKHPEVDEYLAKLESLKNVKFKGHVKRRDILKFLSNAKFLLNTSHYEGFSNTYLEAMSVGTPVLTTSNANPDEIINKYKLGIVYQNSNDLKFQLNSLSETDYQRLSHRAIEYVRKNHDHIQLAEKLSRFLEGESYTDKKFKEDILLKI